MASDKLNKRTASKLYKLSFEHRPQYLYAFVEGEKDSYEISKQYWQEIAVECNEHGFKKVLIEEDIKENVSMSEMYRLTSELPQLGFLGIRIAFVDRQIEQQLLNQFGETVALNRGILGGIFPNFAAAEKWLLSEWFLIWRRNMIFQRAKEANFTTPMPNLIYRFNDLISSNKRGL